MVLCILTLEDNMNYGPASAKGAQAQMPPALGNFANPINPERKKEIPDACEFLEIQVKYLESLIEELGHQVATVLYPKPTAATPQSAVPSTYGSILAGRIGSLAQRIADVNKRLQDIAQANEL